jgi:hypothetical protein
MEYILEDKHFLISYQELKGLYLTYSNFSNLEFINNINKILHTACIICYLKEIPSSICLSDIGIIHELIHVADKTYVEPYEIENVRNLFIKQCKLV